MSDQVNGFPVRPANPKSWWRKVCWVTPNLAVSGDLPWDRTAALAQLRYWESEGITDVFDMRGEANDTEFIHRNSDIRSHWFGVDDNGTPRSDSWFDALTAKGGEILGTPDRKALVQCHMGVNRGPSAAYSILIDQGHEYIDALVAIRSARPIAAMIYAPDAVRWHQRKTESDSFRGGHQIRRVEDWLNENPLDLGYVIGTIGNRLAS